MTKNTNITSKRAVKWPTTTYFTFDDVHQLNPSFDKKITLRVRLANAIEDGVITEIGSVPGGQGRPPKVYVLNPVTQISLDKAEANGISVLGEARKLINVVSVTNVTTPANSPVVA